MDYMVIITLFKCEVLVVISFSYEDTLVYISRMVEILEPGRD